MSRSGHVFEPFGAVIGYLPPNTPMTYFVDRADNIVFLERPGGPRTWSEVVARQARSDVRRTT